MLNINFDIEKELCGEYVQWWASINPGKNTELNIKNNGEPCATIIIPEDVNVESAEIAFTDLKRDSIANKELLRVEAAFVVNGDYYSIVTAYITTKYNETLTVKIHKALEEGGIDIDITR